MPGSMRSWYEDNVKDRAWEGARKGKGGAKNGTSGDSRDTHGQEKAARRAAFSALGAGRSRLPLANVLSARSRPGRTPSAPSMDARPSDMLIDSHVRRSGFPSTPTCALNNESRPSGGFLSSRRRSESNRLMKVLQTSPFPLGYCAMREMEYTAGKGAMSNGGGRGGKKEPGAGRALGKPDNAIGELSLGFRDLGGLRGGQGALLGG